MNSRQKELAVSIAIGITIALVGGFLIHRLLSAEQQEVIKNNAQVETQSEAEEVSEGANNRTTANSVTISSPKDIANCSDDGSDTARYKAAVALQVEESFVSVSSHCALSNKHELIAYVQSTSPDLFTTFKKGFLELDENDELVFKEEKIECEQAGDDSAGYTLSDVADNTLVLHCNSGDSGYSKYERIVYDLTERESIDRVTREIRYETE